MKRKILEAALRVFMRKGPKFTMDDLAEELSMSKKTIYLIFRDKKTMFNELVDFTFDKIDEGEKAVLNDDSLDTEEKLKKILACLPDSLHEMDFASIYQVKDKYPEAYKKIAVRLDTNWTTTFSVLDKGIEDGVFKPVNHRLFQMIYEAAIVRFLSGDELHRAHIGYNDALEQLVNILMTGITNFDNNN